jgi:hypothetical protein
MMIGRTLVVWLAMLATASLNGFVRDTWLTPGLGELGGRALSTVTLSLLVVLLSWLTVRWIGPRTGHDAWAIGGVWLVLTLAFEFLAGHYLFQAPWTRLLEDYNLARGRVWPLVLLTIVLAPQWSARARGLLAGN